MSDLSEVKVGDWLAHRDSWNGLALTKVEKVTKTLIICAAGRFNRERGYSVGSSSSYSRARVWVPTASDLMAFRISRAQRGLKELTVDAGNVGAVEAMLVSVKPARGELEDAAK